MENQEQTNIRKVNIDAIGKYGVTVNYTDGEVAIIDDFRIIPESGPLKLDINIIMICMKGIVQLDINGRTYKIKENDVLFRGPNTVVSNCLISPDFEGKILCISNNALYSYLYGNIEVWNKAVYISKQDIIHIDEKEKAMFANYYKLIYLKMTQENHIYQKEIMRSLLQALMYEFCDIIRWYIDNIEKTAVAQGDLLFKRFIDVLSSNPVKRSVNFYAEQLFVSPKYLSLVSKNVSGKTASEWIHEYMEESIRYHFKSSPKSIKEIADELEFPNLSFFGKYVKSHFGMSPKEYRKQILSAQ